MSKRLIAIIAAAISGIVLAACGTTVLSTQIAVGSLPPAATLSASAAPSSSPPPPSNTPAAPSGLPPDSLALVVTDNLVVRSLPEISDRSTIDPNFLRTGRLLFVMEGPVRADGYDWYRVAPIDPLISDTPPEPKPLLGWVAAGSKDGEAWIEASTAECRGQAGAPDWRPGLRALACLGDQEVVVEGTLVGCAGSVPGNVEPAWFAEFHCLKPNGYVPGDLGGIPLMFKVAPNGPALPDVDASIRIVGHLDDPAAATCRTVRQIDPEPIPSEIVVLTCRAAFVVTEITLLEGGA